MENADTWFRPLPMARWRELVLPKEHGSWSLAAEPLALGLLLAPTLSGASLGLAVAAAFLARRPLRTVWTESRADRQADARAALAGLVVLAVLGFAGALAIGGMDWLAWLVPSAIAGGIFLTFDLRKAGREEAAEVAGAAAFACLPAAFVAMSGAGTLTCAAVAAVMCGRAVPTVLCVRAALRGNKTGVRRPAPALLAAASALMVAAALVRAEAAPLAAMCVLAIFAARALGLLVYPRPALRARTIGIIEAVLGAAFVIALAATWSV